VRASEAIILLHAVYVEADLGTQAADQNSGCVPIDLEKNSIRAVRTVRGVRAPRIALRVIHRTSTPCQGLPLARYAARLPRITLDLLPHSAPAQICSVPTATPTGAGRTPHGVRVFANPGHGNLFCSEQIVGCTCTIRFHMDGGVEKVYEANTAASTCRAGHLHGLRAGLRQPLGRRRSLVNCVRRTINRAGDGRRPRQANNDQCSRMRVGFEHEWSFV
jgi:hypothetical protein